MPHLESDVVSDGWGARAAITESSLIFSRSASNPVASPRRLFRLICAIGVCFGCLARFRLSRPVNFAIQWGFW